jgi:hypothetical protein
LTQAWDLDYAIDYEYQMPWRTRARLVSNFATIPGVTVDEVRKYAGLGPHPDKTIGEMTLNLPGEDAGTGQPGDTPTSNGFPDRNLPARPAARRSSRTPSRSRAPAARCRRTAGPQGLEDEETMTLDEVLARLDALAIAPPEGTVSAAITLPARAPAGHAAASARPTWTPSWPTWSPTWPPPARVLERALLDDVEGKAVFKRPTWSSASATRAAWRTFTEMAEAGAPARRSSAPSRRPRSTTATWA